MARIGTCVCGLKIAHHFTADNRKLSCEETRKLHPRARRMASSLATRLTFVKNNRRQDD